MAQAKTLSKQELKRVLDYNDACERHSERNRAMLLFTHLCGMRIGEVVALRVGDVIDDNDEVNDNDDKKKTNEKKKKKNIKYYLKKIVINVK